MCSHGGHSYAKKPVARIHIDTGDFDETKWLDVMQKSHQLAQQRQQQESVLDIQQEVDIKQLIYPQSLIGLKNAVASLNKNQTLKIKTATATIKKELAAAARTLQCKIEDVFNEQYLYITKI